MTPGSKPSASEYIPAPAARHRLNQIVPICVALVTLVFAAYWRVHNYDFVNYDDEAGILETPAIRTGLNAQNVRWAFSHVHMGNWQPLTNLSHNARLPMVRPSCRSRSHRKCAVSLCEY